jgi:vanillate O-demethylase monooxygenase subunit
VTPFETALRRFWHPVCTLAELAAAREGTDAGPLAAELLGERLVVADLGDGPVVMRDRCLHRSTRLSLGWVDGAALQCAYHGWKWDGSGSCVDVPSLPEGPRPSRRIETFEAAVAYDLVWVRLESGWPTEIPAFPAWDDASLRCVAGEPYTWPVSAGRRVENFVDLAHFAWVHDGTLGDRGVPEVPIPEIRREDAALRFHYDPPVLPEGQLGGTALLGSSAYVVAMPFGVDIDFEVPGIGRRTLWMAACPLDSGRCRTFWYVSRSDSLDGPDEPHLAFQRIVLEEDEPVVAGQDPPELPLEAGVEVSVRTDAVSLAYRSFLRDVAAATDPADLARILCLSRRTTVTTA